MWCKNCPAEYLFKCHQRSALAAQHIAVKHSSGSKGCFQTSHSLAAVREGCVPNPSGLGVGSSRLLRAPVRSKGGGCRRRGALASLQSV